MGAARLSALVTVATLAASCAMPLAQPAAALEPGVHVDPGSPAAKEYSLPVGQARRTGSERESSASSPAQEAAEAASEPLFGGGITPPSSGGGAAGGGSGAGSGGPAGHGPLASHAGAQQNRPSPAFVQRVADGRASSGGGSSDLVLLAGGVAMLALGAFGGVVLRHSRRPTSVN
jgi:hypothetical protein